MSVQLLYDNNMFVFYYVSLALRKCKGHKWEVPTIEVYNDTFVAPVGVIFSKIIKGIYIYIYIYIYILFIFPSIHLEPWQLYLSKSDKFYFFNTKTNKTTNETDPSSVSPYLLVTLFIYYTLTLVPFRTVLSTRHLWMWSRPIFEDICNISTADSTELTWSYLKSTLHALFHEH